MLTAFIYSINTLFIYSILLTCLLCCRGVSRAFTALLLIARDGLALKDNSENCAHTTASIDVKVEAALDYDDSALKSFLVSTDHKVLDICHGESIVVDGRVDGPPIPREVSHLICLSVASFLSFLLGPGSSWVASSAVNARDRV